MNFGIRIINILLVVVALYTYNTTINLREKDDSIAQLTAQVEYEQWQNEQLQAQQLQMQHEMKKAQGLADEEDQKESETLDSLYADGTYQGEADGFGGTISLEVVVGDGVITAVNILSADGEDGVYFSVAQDIIPTILEAQSAQVDTISGATFSSTGIRDAVEQALEKAKS